ncbi:MAG TPA: hypothetical protein VEK79_20775 [Thermoanaerobaculia bacterium]|nr:hypothetical protein [Thermoanaerobaculia bacterium]
MIGNKQLASRLAAALILTTTVGASAFAESRPSNETRARREAGGRISRDRGDRGTPAQSRVEVRGERERSRSTAGRIDRAPSRDTRSRDSRSSVDRPRIDRDRSTTRDNSRYSDRNRRNDSRSRGTYRDSGRSSSRYGGGNSSRYANRSRYYHSGRVHRVYPYGGGYRVWLTGCQYPFYIPSAYYHRNRFRVGVFIGLGGLYNSRGYYDYYDDHYRPGYDDRSTSRGELHGVVESVDYRRETFVVRNEATGSFVTIIMRDRGRDPVRAGDYVELRGDWARDGAFEAYAVDIVDYDRRR